MHDAVKMEQAGIARPRRANDCVNEARNLTVGEALFDGFWREGELALLFGEAGTGKSLLAVQLAESLARGRAIGGFCMPAKRRKTLYVDMKLSHGQFGMRYMGDTEKGYKFSDNLYHDCPPSSDGLAKWLRKMVAENGFRVVVIDDLSAVRQTCDGTRETLPLMRELRRIKEELGVSILVISGSRAPRKGVPVAESDLLRSRILCDVADSVFAAGKHPGSVGTYYLMQTRSRNAVIVWNEANPPMFTIERGNDGFIGAKFDGRFSVPMDEETAWLIYSVKHRRDCGASFRSIAEELGISKARIGRLLKKWTPEIERYFDDRLVRDEEDVRREEEQPESATAVPAAAAAAPAATTTEPSQPLTETVPAAKEWPHDMLANLKHALDGYGRSIYVEDEDYRGKPTAFYRFDSKGRLTRVENKGFHNIVALVDAPERVSSSSDCLAPEERNVCRMRHNPDRLAP